VIRYVGRLNDTTLVVAPVVPGPPYGAAFRHGCRRAYLTVRAITRALFTSPLIKVAYYTSLAGGKAGGHYHVSEPTNRDARATVCRSAGAGRGRVNDLVPDAGELTCIQPPSSRLWWKEKADIFFPSGNCLKQALFGA